MTVHRTPSSAIPGIIAPPVSSKPFIPRRFTLAQHEKLYKLPCGAPKLANFLPNTEECHHQLQVSDLCITVRGQLRR